MFAGYFDESGLDSESRSFWIAGYVAQNPTWFDFQRHWRRTLDAHGVDCFHMSEFENRQGEFRGWTNDSRIALIDELISVMNSFDLWGVGAGVVKEDYRRVIVDSGFLQRSRLTTEWWREPYLYAFQQCISEAAREAHQQLPSGQRITFIFDQQGTFAARATAVYAQMADDRLWSRRERLGGIFFQSKRDSVALQAADILVYELRKRLDHRLYEPDRRIRISVNRLRNRVGSSRFATARELQLFVEQFPEAAAVD